MFLAGKITNKITLLIFMSPHNDPLPHISSPFLQIHVFPPLCLFKTVLTDNICPSSLLVVGPLSAVLGSCVNQPAPSLCHTDYPFQMKLRTLLIYTSYNHQLQACFLYLLLLSSHTPLLIHCPHPVQHLCTVRLACYDILLYVQEHHIIK